MLRLDAIREARQRLAGRLPLTPCTPSESFDDCFAGRLWLKLENLQRTGSFKERGALNRMLAIPAAEQPRGVIAASAGNHAQGVACHATRLGIPSTIVMPERTPLIKVSNTQRYGARVVLHGSSYEEAMEEAMRLQRAGGATLVHPFEDPAVMAGQGTIGLELLDQVSELEAVVVPVGGGGLIAGIATAIKELRPEVRVIGVEAAALPAALRAREAGEPVTIPPGETIAEGVAVRRIGASPFEHIERYVDELVAVDEEEIASAVLLLLEREKTVAEGAGAVGLAALIHGHLPGLAGRNVVVVIGGGNIDVNLLSRIIDRGLVRDGRLAQLRVRVKDRPGTLAALTALIAERGANVLELDHRRGARGLWLTEVEIVLRLETRGHEHVRELIAAFEERGYAVRAG